MKYRVREPKGLEIYKTWIELNENTDKSCILLNYNPRFSVVVPIYDTISYQLEECIKSVLSQIYTNYELILVDNCSTWDNDCLVLQRYENESKIKVIYGRENRHISSVINDGINIADGDFIVFLDCDDTISKDALYWFAEKLNKNKELDFIYSDEDRLTEDGKTRFLPFFKPDWSPDLFMCMMYTNHLSAYRTSLVRQIGGLRKAYNGSWYYDMTLRLLEVSDNEHVGHIPRVLYHCRDCKKSEVYFIGSKDYDVIASCKAKEDVLRRKGIAAHMEVIAEISQCRVVYEVTKQPIVSIIIPSKDNPDLLKQCVETIRHITSYKKYEIIIVDNGSSQQNRNIIEKFLKEYGCKYKYKKQIFNFSRMCNLGVTFADGEYVLFLNDDVEVLQPNWLARLLGQAQQNHTGAVGAKLYYPNTTIIQHDGVVNVKNGPAHLFLKEDDKEEHYYNWNRVDCNFLAVTGACLLVEKKKFEAVGGFNEELAIAYNDVDLCFKLYEKGYYNVLRNDVIAYHHESLSRGIDTLSESKFARLNKERELLYTMHPLFRGYDPFYSSYFYNNVCFELFVENKKGVKYYLKRMIVLTGKTVHALQTQGLVYTFEKIKEKTCKIIKRIV